MFTGAYKYLSCNNLLHYSTFFSTRLSFALDQVQAAERVCGTYKVCLNNIQQALAFNKTAAAKLHT